MAFQFAILVTSSYANYTERKPYNHQKVRHPDFYEFLRLKAISHEQKFANPTLNSTVRSTQNLIFEFNLPSDMEVGVEENTLNPVDFSGQSWPNLVSEPIR
ncbi:hypothetical protein AVEN_95915-1 [Araneus ventricosus]|uniref:Uncharacterized protein n=1 Tax=Araneus ventricosus TaxID=182803 RepID=A0A4Y2HRV7_ARAVE|nr:hypothetical protein AVEN_95915-1 [Araneus ventricosus]